jgi:HEAT repeat protein
MDNSLALARYFARLVWLLIHESESTSEQKLALRAVVVVSKEASVRLGNKEGRLAVNGLVMPQALAGVRELAERLASHSIEEIEIEIGATPAELLALARLLAVGAASTSDAADFSQKLSELEKKTVHVRLAAKAPAAPARTSGAAERSEEDASATVAVTAGRRVERLWERLAAATDAHSAQRVLDELAFTAEQATREGRTSDVADQFTTLLDCEAKVEDPTVRPAYVMAVRRLTKPTVLRPIARLLITEPAQTQRTERILQRCAQDGVDAVVDQYLGATSNRDRQVYRDVLFRLVAAREALVQMLLDPRWYVVRQASEFLGEIGAQEAERALADLLRHPDERVRRAVTRALGRIDSPFTLDALARALTDDDASVRLEAVAGLTARKGARAGSTLAGAIDGEDDVEVQFTILAAMGRVATPETVAKLAAAAAAASGLFKSKKNSALRIAAVIALGDAHTPAALAAIQGLANDREQEVRDAVARTLISQRGTAA